MTEESFLRLAIANALKELGVPDENYPAPVANAVAILSRAVENPEVSNERVSA